MILNLITDPWIPVETRSGAVRKIRPAEIVDRDIVGLALPRPDFNGAATEMLIGLLTTAFAPADEAEWRDRWTARPTVADLDAAFEPLKDAFCITRFMQRAEVADRPTPVERLLLDASGDKAAEDGKDFINRGGVEALSPSMAAAALMAHQFYATEGGSDKAPAGDVSGKSRVGYAVSIRAGGPLTTLIVSGDDLWGHLWPNVETTEQLTARGVSTALDLPAMLPWLRPDREASITPGNAAPQMVYWGTPRRVRIALSPANGEVCSLTGEASEMLVREVHREAGGTTYAGWTHPLTPRYLDKDDVWRAVRARPEVVGYRDWLGLVQATPDDDRQPAHAVSHARLHRWQLSDARLVAHGFASNQSTIHRWTESEMPLLLADPDTRQEREALARHLVTAARLIADRLKEAVIKAGGVGWRAAEAYWRITEALYHMALREPLDMNADDPSRAIRAKWLVEVRRAVYGLYDEATDGDASARAMEQVVAERFRLSQDLNGYGKQGKALMEALGLPLPFTREKAA